MLFVIYKVLESLRRMDAIFEIGRGKFSWISVFGKIEQTMKHDKMYIGNDGSMKTVKIELKILFPCV